MNTYIELNTVCDGGKIINYSRVYYEREMVIYVCIDGDNINFDNLLNMEELESSTPIPLEIFPVYEKSLFDKAFTEPPKGWNIRRPRILSFNGWKPETATVCDTVRTEYRVYKLEGNALNLHLVSCLGCLVRRDCIIGFFMEKYRATIFEWIEQWVIVDVDAVVSEVRESVEHLHSLGFCHNNLHFDNIKFDDNDTPVLIDNEIATPANEH